ncbi:MAG: bifunctional DNA-formamidopyrimidine glycosylase/DNA-(apurinic or apyrimidinic site) lyase [Zoogloeaceae bacterium]|jgi:formamidopyrimidine-DNA glycosylase|nr:bifunctional DNA-formamidopyrimidine glycosylase/DNA-(apurinic or apyrimidinic site) lyase [Zoogloeaceae bacterium]
MPELPEVEVSRLGLLPRLVGKTVTDCAVRRADLRLPVPQDLRARLLGHRLAAIARRGKYLLFHWPTADGWLIVHLGMSGSLRLAPPDALAGAHDHFDLCFPAVIMRLRDPRRFGVVLWQVGDNPEAHPLLARLGMEPLSPGFTADWLANAVRGRKTPIKSLLMNAALLTGVGNIYAAESLFRAGISPSCPAGSLKAASLEKLAAAVRETLLEAIEAGGSSVRDYVRSDGGAGSFQLRCAVYDRAGQPCPRCGAIIRQFRQSGRSSFYCPRCQRP